MKLKKIKLGVKDFWYRGDDRYVGQRIALGKYEPYLTKLILKNVDSNSNGIAVDVGANIGYYTVLLANKAKTVMGIEPEEKTFKILTKNSEGLKNVNLVKVAAGNKDGVTELEVSKENYGDHRIKSNDLRFMIYDLGIKQETEIKKLDDLISGQVDLMKIDVQGWESEVIGGAKK